MIPSIPIGFWRAGVGSPPPNVLSITASKSVDGLTAGQESVVTAFPIGGSAAATFAIISGVGSLTTINSTSTTYKAPNTIAADAVIVVRATHADDALVYEDVNIQIYQSELFTVSLTKDGPDPINAGDSLGVTAVVVGGFESVSFGIQSGGGSLSLLTGNTAQFDSDAMDPGPTVIRATHDDNALVYDQVTITANAVVPLTISLAKDGSDPIQVSGTLGVTATVGGGAATAVFSIQSGPGSLSLVTGTTAQFNADAVTTGSTVIRSAHVGDAMVFDEVTIVTATPVAVATATSDPAQVLSGQMYYANNTEQFRMSVNPWEVIAAGKVYFEVITTGAYYSGSFTMEPTAGGTPHISFTAPVIFSQSYSAPNYKTIYESTVTPINGAMLAPGFESWTAWYPASAAMGTVPPAQECTFRVYNTFP